MPARILVVDDEEAIREIIVSMLHSVNYDCRVAADGLEALAILDSGEHFELVVSNLMMPAVVFRPNSDPCGPRSTST